MRVNLIPITYANLDADIKLTTSSPSLKKVYIGEMEDHFPHLGIHLVARVHCLAILSLSSVWKKSDHKCQFTQL